MNVTSLQNMLSFELNHLSQSRNRSPLCLLSIYNPALDFYYHHLYNVQCHIQ